MKKALVEQVWARAHAACEYCHLPQDFDPMPFQIDHVVSIKHGGETVTDNLALACFPCNSYKGPNIAGLDHQTSEVVRLYHPRKDSWTDHFRWEGPALAGLTPIGRVTLHVLMSNRPEAVELRRLLIVAGVFP